MIRELRARLASRLRKRLGFPIEELALARLRRNGFTPRVAFDVGASYGLFVDQIWAHWPNAVVHCFEPEPEYVAAFQQRAKGRSNLFVCPQLVGSTAADGMS